MSTPTTTPPPTLTFTLLRHPAHGSHLLLRLLVAGLLFLLCACAGVDRQNSTAAGNPQFAADWQEHGKPLINQGPGFTPGTTAWWMPSTLPRGHYRLIRRVGNGMELVDGYQFDIDGNAMKEIHLMLPAAYNEVWVLDERYVGSARPVGYKN
ncbi:MAG: hypothetical protein V4488_07165 [Pseudomonadota bacterium]